MRSKVRYLYNFILVSLAVLGPVDSTSPVCQPIPGPPGRDGRDGTPGSNGVPGTFSYDDYLKLKKELRHELKQELLQELKEKCCQTEQSTGSCSSIFSPSTTDPSVTTSPTQGRLTASFSSSTTIPSPILPSNTVLQSKTLSPSTTNPSSDMAPSTTLSPTPERIGDCVDRPAQSCHHVYQTDSSSPSGYYWINTTEGPTKTYCVMNPPSCNITGGWMRVALHNMTDPRTACLGNTIEHTVDGKRFCAVSQGSHCDRVVFPVRGKSYSHVCGRALGYSFNAPCGFLFSFHPLSEHYLTGLSITHGSIDHHSNHIWSYAAGYRELRSFDCNCPCAAHPGVAPPDYVGNDYYCDTSSDEGISSQWFTNNTLWDGKDCYPGSNCCANTRLPWFSKRLRRKTNEDITVRWCADRDLNSTNIGTELLEILIL